MKMCAIVPAYNAAATLHHLLQTLISFSPCVVVVDDGSEDETAAIAGKFGPQGVILLEHKKNQGKGAALRTGFHWAIKHGFEMAVTIDSDLQHAPDDLPGILDVFETDRLDILVGSRFDNLREIPGARRFGNRFSSWIATCFCRRTITDSQCGYRIYRLAPCHSILLNSTLKRFDAETEVIIKGALKGLRIGFAPISVIYPDSKSYQSHYRVFRDTALIVWFYFKELCRRLFTPCGRQDNKRLKHETI